MPAQAADADGVTKGREDLGDGVVCSPSVGEISNRLEYSHGEQFDVVGGEDYAEEYAVHRRDPQGVGDELD